MEPTAKEAFAARLIEAMKDAGHRSARNAKSGVDVVPLATAAKVTREMARRYTKGTAIPDLNKMHAIAASLGIRLAWLRDGEGTKRPGTTELREPSSATYNVDDSALEIARAWSKLPPERREVYRSLMAVEAIVANHYPWLVSGPKARSQPKRRAIDNDILRLAELLKGK